MTRQIRFAGLLLATCLTAVSPAGCSLDLAALLPDDADPSQTSGGQRHENEIVTIRFRNLTASEAVHVEFYATTQPLGVLPDDLFLPEHLVTASIGIAGTGIIPPQQPDVIEFPCTPTLTIGTLGGTFVDVESGEPRGQGVPRWAQEGPLGLCGSMVTFDFSGDPTAFGTTLSIGR